LRSSVGLVSTCFSPCSIVLLCKNMTSFLSEELEQGHAETFSTGYVAPAVPSHFGLAFIYVRVRIISKGLIRTAWSDKPLAKSCRPLPTGFRGQQRRMPTGCFVKPISNALGQEISCRRRFVVLISRSPLHY
jgi:hypothetical protein